MNYGLPEVVTQQTLFDKAVTHLFTQGRKAVDRHGSCKYRDPEGGACGVGCFISDDRYEFGIEGKSAGSYEVMSLVPELRDHEGLVNEIQDIHDYAEMEPDGSFDRKKLAMRLAKVAKRRALSFEAIETQMGQSVEAFS